MQAVELAFFPEKKGGDMVSIWLMVWAFLIGGFVGMLGFALTAMAGREEEHAAKAEKAIAQHGPVSVDIDKDWIDADRWSVRFG